VPGLAIKAKFVHHPVGLGAPWSPAHVEHQRLLHPHQLTPRLLEDLPVLAGGLPVALLGGAVRARARRVFHVLVAEEVPLLLSHVRLA